MWSIRWDSIFLIFLFQNFSLPKNQRWKNPWNLICNKSVIIMKNFPRVDDPFKSILNQLEKSSTLWTQELFRKKVYYFFLKELMLKSILFFEELAHVWMEICAVRLRANWSFQNCPLQFKKFLNWLKIYLPKWLKKIWNVTKVVEDMTKIIWNVLKIDNDSLQNFQLFFNQIMISVYLK